MMMMRDQDGESHERSGYRVEIDTVSATQWAEIIDSFDDATIYQTWPWGAVRWGRKNLSHLVLRRGQEAIAAGQCWIIKMPAINRGIAYFKCGPIWQKSHASARRDELELIVRALKQEYAEKRGLLLRIMVNGINGHNYDIEPILTQEGFCKCRRSVPYRTIILGLDCTEMELRKAAKRQWLNNLKHAEKHPFEVIEGGAEILFDKFNALHRETVSRKGFNKALKVDELRHISTLSTEPCKARVIMCALDGEPLSGVLVCPSGKNAVILFSANTVKGLELHASQYVWWHTAQILKQAGVRWLDLGGIDPDTCPGTYQFKKGFAGALGDDTTFEQYDYCNSVASKVAASACDWFRTWTNNR